VAGEVDPAGRAYQAELEAVAIHGAGDVAATAWPPRERLRQLRKRRR